MTGRAKVRCPMCSNIIGMRMEDGSVEIREGGKLIAQLRWGKIGCGRCGWEQMQDVVPTPAAGERARDQWTVVGETGSS